MVVTIHYNQIVTNIQGRHIKGSLPEPYLSPTTWFQVCQPVAVLLDCNQYLGQTYKGVFCWMAVEHLCLHGPNSQLHSKLLSLTVVHGKQAPKPDWPSDFLLHIIHVLCESSANYRQSTQIQLEGRLGAILMSVTFTNTLNGLGPTLFMYFDFPEPINPDYKYAPPQLRRRSSLYIIQWAYLLKPS